jgi:hypothetical protein
MNRVQLLLIYSNASQSYILTCKALSSSLKDKIMMCFIRSPLSNSDFCSIIGLGVIRKSVGITRCFKPLSIFISVSLILELQDEAKSLLMRDAPWRSRGNTYRLENYIKHPSIHPEQNARKKTTSVYPFTNPPKAFLSCSCSGNSETVSRRRQTTIKK